MDYDAKAVEMHKKWRGKLDVVPKMRVSDKESLSIAYTPGVAAPCLEIQKNEELSFAYTGRGNTIAVVTDGTAVLGLGDIGSLAAMPVMEGKCVLFKEFGGVNAVPLCIDSKDTDELIRVITLISGSFGGINLEDISAPRCFEIERRLKETLDIPVFHDDQHGTAVVTLAAVINALKTVNKQREYVRVVISGAGAAGIAVTKLLMAAGFGDITLCDTKGAIYKGRGEQNAEKETIALVTNKRGIKSDLRDCLTGADVFIGLSAPGTVSEEMVRGMAKDPVLLPMANPIPEIMPNAAFSAGAAVVGTGRSDFPNQINNVLAFPGIFRGALDSRARDINEHMLLAAAYALAGIIRDDELRADCIIPAPFDPRVGKAVAEAVAQAAVESGAAAR